MLDIDLGTRLQELRQAFAESQQQIVEARRKLGSLTAKAEYRDGSILVILDAQGRITQLTFRGDSYRDLEPEELSRRILSVVTEAHVQLRRSFAEVMPRSPWGGLSVDEMLDPNTDVSQMLPDSLFSSPGAGQAGAAGRSQGRGRRG
ncbi:MAG TPA: YbaB/EbfC family nucleoid-associated protein [Kineosporiaceae bacterium]|nr:YbaB/EbfC family nucleoid-associated protein [Kineosporiaceae bacterium]